MEILDREPRLGRRISKVQAPGLPLDEWWQVVKALLASSFSCLAIHWCSTSGTVTDYGHTSTYTIPVISSISIRLSSSVISCISHGWFRIIRFFRKCMLRNRSEVDALSTVCVLCGRFIVGSYLTSEIRFGRLNVCVQLTCCVQRRCVH